MLMALGDRFALNTGKVTAEQRSRFDLDRAEHEETGRFAVCSEMQAVVSVCVIDTPLLPYSGLCDGMRA